jgi:hypothetical protein
MRGLRPPRAERPGEEFQDQKDKSTAKTAKAMGLALVQKQPLPSGVSCEAGIRIFQPLFSPPSMGFSIFRKRV